MTTTIELLGAYGGIMCEDNDGWAMMTYIRPDWTRDGHQGINAFGFRSLPASQWHGERDARIDAEPKYYQFGNSWNSIPTHILNHWGEITAWGNVY